MKIQIERTYVEALVAEFPELQILAEQLKFGNKAEVPLHHFSGLHLGFLGDLYQQAGAGMQVKHCPSQLLGNDIHTLIANSKNHLDDKTKMVIYEYRLLAETRLSRPVMKGFKALIREQGLFKA